LWQLAGLARGSGCGAEALALIKTIAEEEPSNGLVAFYRYKALMNARRFAEAGAAASLVDRAMCGESGARTCGAGEAAVVAVRVTLMELEAQRSLLREAGVSDAEILRRLGPAAEEAIRAADAAPLRQEADSVDRTVFEKEWPVPLAARSVYLSMLEGAQEWEEVPAETCEFFVQCPRYLTSGECHRIWETSETLSRARGLSLRTCPVLGAAPSSFDADRWRSGDRATRGAMAEELVHSRFLLNKTMEEVVRLLGPPNLEDAWTMQYFVDVVLPVRDDAIELRRSGDEGSGGSERRLTYLKIWFDKRDMTVMGANLGD